MKEELLAIIGNYVSLDGVEVSEESSLRNVLSMSSLDLINMAVEIEDTFGIQFPDKDIPNIVTFGDLLNYIEEAKKD